MTEFRYQLPQLLSKASLAYIVVWVISPPLAYGGAWRALALLAVMMWFALELGRKHNIIRYPTPTILIIAGYVVYTLAVELLVPDRSTLSRHYQVWIMLFFLVVYEARRRHGLMALRYLFWLALILLPVWMWMTLDALDTLGSGVARIMTRSSELSAELSEGGIGGYGLVYSVVVAIPVLAYFVTRPREIDWSQVSNKKVVRRCAWALMALNLVLAIMLVLNAGFSFGVLLVLGGLLVLVLARGRGKKPIVRAVILSVLGLAVLYLSIDPVFDQLTRISEGTEYSAKVADVRASLLEDSAVGTVEGRTERYSRSLGLFLAHPLAGTLSFDDVGKHSAFLDRLAEYGLVPGIGFIFLLLLVPLRAVRTRGLDRGLTLSVLFVIAGFAMINNVFAAFGFMLFIFYPVALTLTKAVALNESSGPRVGELERRHSKEARYA